ncbi:MAG TPA: hypothetical protein VGF99_21150, partial [Myxococcota bacterium]
NDFGGAVTITSADDVSLDDADSVTFNSVSATGEVNVDAAGSVAFNGNATAATLAVDTNANGGAGGDVTQIGTLSVSGTTILDAGTSDVTLTNTSNDFGGVVAITEANNVSLDDANGLSFGAVSATGAADVDAAGAVDFGGAAAVGSLDVDTHANGGSGGNVAQSGGSLSVSGTTTLETGTGDVSLTSATNDFSGVVIVANAHDVSVDDANSLSFGNVNATGAVNVDAAGAVAFNGTTNAAALDVDSHANGGSGGNVTQAGVITVTGATNLDAGSGDVTLTNAANDFGGAVGVAGATNVALDDANDLTFGAVSATGNVAVDAAGSVAFNGTASVGSLDVDTNANGGAGGNVTQTGSLTVAGATNLDAGTSDVALTHTGNDFAGSVTITNADDVSLDDANSLLLADVVATGALDVDTAGAVEFSGSTTAASLEVDSNANGGSGGYVMQSGGSLTVAGATTFDAGTGNVSFTQATNDFGGAVGVTSADDVSLDDANNVTFSGVSAAGALDVDAAGAVAFTGVASVGSLDVDTNANGGSGGNVSQTQTVTVAGTTNLDAGSSNVVLDHATNDFGGAVSIAAAEDATIADVNDLEFANADVNDRIIATAGGNVVGGTVSAAVAQFTATGSVGASGDALQTHVSLLQGSAGTGVFAVDNSGDLTIGESGVAAGGDVAIANDDKITVDSNVTSGRDASLSA